jgi:hypothetical protein
MPGKRATLLLASKAIFQDGHLSEAWRVQHIWVCPISAAAAEDAAAVKGPTQGNTKIASVMGTGYQQMCILHLD